METRPSGPLGVARIDEIFLLNPAKDMLAIDTVSCLAVIFQSGKICTLIHAVNTQEEYDPFAAQLTLVSFLSDKDVSSELMCSLKKLSISVSSWDWYKFTLENGQLIVDMSMALYPAASNIDQVYDLSINQRSDTIQLTGKRHVIDKLLSFDLYSKI